MTSSTRRSSAPARRCCMAALRNESDRPRSTGMVSAVSATIAIRMATRGRSPMRHMPSAIKASATGCRRCLRAAKATISSSSAAASMGWARCTSSGSATRTAPACCSTTRRFSAAMPSRTSSMSAASASPGRKLRSTSSFPAQPKSAPTAISRNWGFPRAFVLPTVKMARTRSVSRDRRRRRSTWANKARRWAISSKAGKHRARGSG